MRIAIVVTTAAMLFLSACSVNKLKNELARAESSYAYVKIAPITGQTQNESIVLVLFQRTEAGLKRINYRTPAAGDDSYFLVPQADYTVMAFEDLNNDLIYQEGEPAASSDNPPLYTDIVASKAERDYQSIPSQALELDAEHRLPTPIDLSTQTLSQTVSDSKSRYLQVVDWEFPAFQAENVKKGLWEPLSFLEEFGYGLYLLEELDPEKQPLLLVHGINSSPLNFRGLAAQLDDRYQLMLFQYPSGFPLDYTAYILHRAVDDFLQRHPSTQLHVLAHSMGGLVGRGMLVLNDANTNARINTYITLSTPWSGHEAARMGIEWSPAVAPVWKSMVPGSIYLQQMFAEPLAPNISHYLFFTFSDSRNGKSKGDDGVVTVQSQLNYQAQQGAASVFGIDDSHAGILENPCAVGTIQVLLARKIGEPLPVLPSCLPDPH